MHRHALVLAVVSLIVARSATTETALVIRNVVTFQRYRAERRRRALEKQARERETPLNTPALEKKMVDLVGVLGTRLISLFRM
jgi:ATP-binding cassette subfamily D (ALD) long-chain fatty acid import protein